MPWINPPDWQVRQKLVILAPAVTSDTFPLHRGQVSPPHMWTEMKSRVFR